MIRFIELLFIIAGFVALGTWLFSDQYENQSALAMIISLTIASVYILLTNKEKIYRIFASASLTVIAAAVGIALLRWYGLTG